MLEFSLKSFVILYLDCIDFDLLISSLPKGLISERAFNKKTRELINSLAFVYDLDTLKMGELLRSVVNENGVISKDELRIRARKYYQFNNNGSLPTLIYREQPSHLKTPEGDTSNRGKMLYIFEKLSSFPKESASLFLFCSKPGCNLLLLI